MSWISSDCMLIVHVFGNYQFMVVMPTTCCTAKIKLAYANLNYITVLTICYIYVPSLSVNTSPGCNTSSATVLACHSSPFWTVSQLNSLDPFVNNDSTTRTMRSSATCSLMLARLSRPKYFPNKSKLKLLPNSDKARAILNISKSWPVIPVVDIQLVFVDAIIKKSTYLGIAGYQSWMMGILNFLLNQMRMIRSQQSLPIPALPSVANFQWRGTYLFSQQLWIVLTEVHEVLFVDVASCNQHHSLSTAWLILFFSL